MRPLHPGSGSWALHTESREGTPATVTVTAGFRVYSRALSHLGVHTGQDGRFHRGSWQTTLDTAGSSPSPWPLCLNLSNEGVRHGGPGGLKALEL